jgi:hypothetical protein
MTTPKGSYGAMPPSGAIGVDARPCWWERLSDGGENLLKSRQQLSSPPALWGLVGGLRDEASAAEARKRIHFGNVSTAKQGSQLFGLFLRQADPNWIPFWFFLSCGHRRHHDHAPFSRWAPCAVPCRAMKR